jgi:hypothetical protein
MDLPDFDSSDPAPPPYSHQEFDAKLDLTLQVSATEVQNHQPSPPPQNQSHQSSVHSPSPTPEDWQDWQEWDETAFKAAEQRLKAFPPPPPPPLSSIRPLPVPQPSASGSSQLEQLPTVRPLNVQKKAHPSAQPSDEKRRQSWQPNAQPNPSSSSNYYPSHPDSQGTSRTSDIETALHDLGLSDSNDALPPPPFAAVGPSLDGPAYQDIMRADPNNPPSRQQRQLLIRRPHSDSPPPSPLHPALTSQNAPRPSSSERPDRNHSHMSMPPPISPTRNYNPPMHRTVSAYATPPRIVQPKGRTAFDSSSAYHDSVVNPSQDYHSHSTSTVNASAFYKCVPSSIHHSADSNDMVLLI